LEGKIVVKLSLEIPLSHVWVSTKDSEDFLCFDASFHLNLPLTHGLEEGVSSHSRAKVLEHPLLIIHRKSRLQAALSEVLSSFHLK